MADRVETLVAPTRDELWDTITMLGPGVVPLTKPRRARGGGWFVQVQGAPIIAPTPAPARREWVLPTLIGVMVVGGAAAVVVAVMAVAWVVDHILWVLAGTVVLGWLAGKVKRWW